MPLLPGSIRNSDGGSNVASLHRALQNLSLNVDVDEQRLRVFGPATEALLRELQAAEGLASTGELDEPTRLRIEAMLQETVPFTVYGRLTDSDGRPIAEATIFAVDMDLRRNETLGRTTTDSEGEYEVRYSADKFTRSEKARAGADLLVRALLADERVAESKTLFNAPPDVRIDLSSHRAHGRPEFERLLAAFDGALGRVPLAELTDEDVAFLAGDSGEDGARIAMLAQAHRMAVPEVPAETIFGWLAQGMPADLDALSRRSQESLEASLALAAQANTVSAATGGRGAAYASAVLDVRARRTIEAATVNGAPARDPWLGQILTTFGADRFARFAAVFSGHDDDQDALAARLAESGFEPNEMAQARNVLALKAISRGHAPLLEAISSAARLDDPRSLAALDVADWRKLLATPTASGGPVGAPAGVPGRTVDEQLGNYAKLLTAEVEARLPTERFHHRASRDLGNRGRILTAERRQDWVRFFSANPDFDIRKTNLETLLGDDAARDRRLAGLSDRETLVKDVETIQRLFRLVPEPLTVDTGRPEGLPLTDRYDAVVTLMEGGFHSAAGVLSVPERVFETKYSVPLGTREVARRVYMRAAYIGDAALLTMLKARSLVDDTSPAFASVSDYAALFGPSDLCDCEHCRSFFGPAAYFVDSLQFLREAGAGADDPDALWNLLDARRPDLKRIALTCANANTELPYLDLVNEVLEEAVAPTIFIPFALTPRAGFDPLADLDARQVTAGLRAAFLESPNVIALSSATTIHLIVVATEGVPRGKQWFITDRGTMYAVFSGGNNETADVLWASRQTSGTTEELVAAPEHFNQGAYQRLAASGFPWSLPFDLGWEEIRGLLDESGLSLHDVVTAFEAVGDGPLAPIDALESAAAVRELLGLSEADVEIIQGTRAGPPEAYWNVPSGPLNWHLALAPVDVLLERAGLRYAELLRLLDTRFVNPVNGVGRTLSIVSIDPAAAATCDLTKLVVDGLDPAALDRLHRFVRLWRRLGWTASDLDIVLRALGATDLTAKVLTEVSHVERLRRTLELPLDQIAALFAPIDTVRYQSFAEEGARWLPSLYDRVFRFTAGGARVDAAFVEEAGLLTGTIDEQAPAIRAALAFDPPSFEALIASGGVLRGHDLTLANLSRLFRHAVLARRLGLTSQDLLRAIRLVGGAGAGTPRSVGELIAAAARLAATGLVLDDLELILASIPEVDARLGRSAADVQRVLGELRQRMLEVEVDDKATDPEPKARAEARAEEQRRERLIQGLATATGLSPALVATIDRMWASLLQQLTVPTPAPPSAPAPAPPLPGGDVLLRLGKLARLLRFAQLPDAEAAWLCARATDLGMPDLLALPVTSQDARVRFAAFESLLDFLDARSAARNPLEPLYLVIERALLAGSSLTSVVDALATATGWSEADIRWCLSAPARVVAVRDEVTDALREPATYARMKRALGFAGQLGAPAATVAAIAGRADRPRPGPGPGPVPQPGPLGNPPLQRWTTARRAEELTRLVRARRGPGAWLAIARPLNDRLRERRRDALVAYLLHVRPNGLPVGVRSAADLFAHFLVDVEMSACMRTSRIKHAVSTVQTFIQRCLMRLEGDDVRLDPEKAREWTEWRSIYRIWEANRKVFLYPENWLEPELRETRTPFFKELESELNNAELTPERAERIVRGYIEKLEGVSNLEPVAIHREHTASGHEVVHVVARTVSTPHVHYYRHRTKVVTSDPGTWSPWQRVDVEVDSEHVILLVLQGHLRLYWAAIREVVSTALDGKTGEVRWGITLYWSEYDAGHWSRRQELKPERPVTIPARRRSPIEGVSFRARVVENRATTTPEATIFPAYTVELDCHFRLPEPLPLVSPTLRPTASGAFQSMTLIFDSAGHGDGSPQAPSALRNLAPLQDGVVYGMGYRTSAGLKHLPAACLEANDVEASLYAFDDQRTFQLLEERDRAGVNTVLSPTLASALPTKISTEGVMSIYEAGFPPPEVILGNTRFDVSFDRSGPEQAYYWELFFHVPLLIATRFLRDRRFADARRWLHCIFDPTHSTGTGAERFWITRPFRDLAKWHPDAVRALIPSSPNTVAEQVAAMRSDPFRPHAIAALRIAAYMRTTFFRYVDVLIEWGDHLFRRETIESLNEATQLYVLARALLGVRPENVPARALPAPQTFESLTADPDFDSDLANAEVEIGDIVIPNLTTLPPPTPSLGSVALFSFPRNDRLGRYHDTVEDRLYKVRHCKNIQGSALLLSLWDAPIDPALLLRATAAGLDLQQILGDLAGAGPPFRFNVLAQKANELCGEVKAFGAALLSALEKRDAEKLGRLRAHHEVELLGRTRDVRQAQLEEARLGKAALEKSLALIDARGQHYARLLGAGRQALPAVGDEGGLEALAGTVAAPPMMVSQGTPMLVPEFQDFRALADAQAAQLVAAGWELAAAFAHPLTAGIGASVSASYFGLVGVSVSTNMTMDIGAALSATASNCRAFATHRSADSTRLSKQAALMLRAHDWSLQLKLVVRERAQVEAQILAAEIREAIAERELANHRRQIEEAREVERFLRDKYTNEELYDWTIGELSKLYFASYRLAQGMARRAEAAYRREIGKATTTSIIGKDHWDGYYSGLLAGERLSQDIRRLEVAYLDDCERRYELTKHISLAQVDPEKLLQLRESGSCKVTLHEAMFDADYPKHELRRIKAVAVTIPAVTGPYAGVHCKLKLGATRVRRNGALEPKSETWGTDTIVTSHGVNDSGLFEQNLRDERFLPFEGAGAIESDWTIELMPEQNTFDLQTVADFILHLRYTATPGTRTEAPSPIQPSCLFDLRREFPDAWYRWKAGTAAAPLLVQIDRDRLPFTRGTIASTAFKLYARLGAGTNVTGTLAGGTVVLSSDAGGGDYGELWYSAGAPSSVSLPASGDLAIDVSENGASLRASVEDLYLVCQYTSA